MSLKVATGWKTHNPKPTEHNRSTTQPMIFFAKVLQEVDKLFHTKQAHSLGFGTQSWLPYEIASSQWLDRYTVKRKAVGRQGKASSALRPRSTEEFRALTDYWHSCTSCRDKVLTNRQCHSPWKPGVTRRRRFCRLHLRDHSKHQPNCPLASETTTLRRRTRRRKQWQQQWK